MPVGAHHFPDRVDEPIPDSPLQRAAAAASGGSEPVELRATIVLGEPPLRLDPSALIETMQRRIQRPFADDEHFAGELLNPPRDRVPVRRPPRERLEHEQIERSLQ